MWLRLCFEFVCCAGEKATPQGTGSTATLRTNGSACVAAAVNRSMRCPAMSVRNASARFTFGVESLSMRTIGLRGISAIATTPAAGVVAPAGAVLLLRRRSCPRWWRKERPSAQRWRRPERRRCSCPRPRRASNRHSKEKAAVDVSKERREKAAGAQQEGGSEAVGFFLLSPCRPGARRRDCRWPGCFRFCCAGRHYACPISQAGSSQQAWWFWKVKRYC